MLLGADPSADEVVADGVRQRQVVVPRRGHVAVLHHRVVDVPAERLLDVGHILHDGDAAHRDLLPPVVIRLHLRGHLSSHLVCKPTAAASTRRLRVRLRAVYTTQTDETKQSRYLQTTLPGARDLDPPRFRLQRGRW